MPGQPLGVTDVRHDATVTSDTGRITGTCTCGTGITAPDTPAARAVADAWRREHRT